MKPLPNYVCTQDYELGAQDKLNSANKSDIWRYIQGSSVQGITNAKNRTDFDAINLQPSVLKGAFTPDLSCNVLGYDMKTPLLLAPIAYQKLLDELGELASVHAAMAQDVGFCLSTLASHTIEDIASIARQAEKTAPLIFQLYVQPELSDNLNLIQRAMAQGFDAIMITVDAPINGLRYHEARDRFSLPSGVSAVNLTHSELAGSGLSHSHSINALMQVAPSWDDIAYLIEASPLPVIIKGLINPNDGLLAQQAGASGIVVSNHGGRILDGVASSISVLPQFRNTLGDEFTILFDSGIRSGSDIYKALALGANACLIGRPYLYALNVAGAMGVAHILKLLKDELALTMALMGTPNIQVIRSDTCITNF